MLLLCPHPDDIALALGGTLARLRRARGTLVDRLQLVTIFSESTFSPYRALPDRLSVSRARRAEEARFAARIGIAWVDLGLPDASCLGYDAHTELGKIADGDDRAGRVEAGLSALPAAAAGVGGGAIWLAPAAIGEHLDHRMVRDAALRIAGPDHCILYEEPTYAYALSEEAVGRAIETSLPGAIPLSVSIHSSWQQKLDCLACYQTQFGRPERARIARHAWRVGLGTLCERMWCRRTAAGAVLDWLTGSR